MSKIRLHGSSSGYTEIAPVAASGNNTLTLPNDGTIISHDGNGAVGVTSITVGTGVTIGDGRVTCTTLHGSAANCTQIPAANIVGVCTAGFERTGGFGGGKVLQIVQRYDSSFTRNANASSTYADTAHYVEITPTAASSKILVNISGACNNNGAGNVIYMDIYRSIDGGSYSSISPNGTSVPTAGFTLNKGDQSRNEIPMNIMYLDSPSYSLGNAIVYKLYIRNNGSGSVEVPSNPSGEPVICIAQEIAA